MKGILLAGGNGTRLYPITFATSKQLLPVYNKPMIYYPLATLMQLGITDICIITTNSDKEAYYRLLGAGKEFGIKLTYLVQDHPNGIAEAFIIAEKLIGSDDVCLILGDNIFYNLNYRKIQKKIHHISGAVISVLYHDDPTKYGVAEFCNDQVISIEEKPENPKSKNIIPGLYFYDNTVVNIVKNLKPSHRGEFEITDINKKYLSEKQLRVIQFDENVKWFDAGNPDDLLNAALFIQQKQFHSSRYIACLEEISYEYGYIDKKQMKEHILKHKNTEYGMYLQGIINEI